MSAEYLTEYSSDFTPLSPTVGSYKPLPPDYYDIPWTPTPRSTPTPLTPEYSPSSLVGTLLSLDLQLYPENTLCTPTALTQEYAPSSHVIGTSLYPDFDISWKPAALSSPVGSIEYTQLYPENTSWTPTALTQEYGPSSPIGTSLSLDFDILWTPTASSPPVGSIEYTQLYPEDTPTALTQEYAPSFPVGTRGFDIPWTPTPLSSHVGSIEYTQLYPAGTPLTPEYMDSESSKEYHTPITLWLFDH